MVKAMYAFSGDPITYGHEDVVKRAAAIFSEVVVGIGVNPDKKYTFTIEERVDMAERALSHIPNVKVTPFRGLLVDYAKENGIGVVVKGVRNNEDSEYEALLHWVGESQGKGIETSILFAREDLRKVSSSAAKALQKEQGDLRKFVPFYVKQKLEERISGQYIVGVSGEIGAGKSYVSDKFLELGDKYGVQVHNLDLDEVGHHILGELTEPYYVDIRKKVVERFGGDVAAENGFINRKKLGNKVFNDGNALKDLDKIMAEPMVLRTRREMYGKKGLILINGALLAEAGWTYFCNNNVLLVKCDKESQTARLRLRGLSDEQIERRVASQYSFEKKKEIIENCIKRDNCGKVFVVENSVMTDSNAIENSFLELQNYLGFGGK